MEENRVQATEQQMILSCLQTMLANQKKNQRRQRIQLACTIVAACAMVGILGAVVFFGNRAVAKLESTAAELETAVRVVTTTMESVDELADKLNQVDYQELTQSVKALTDAGTNGINQALGKMDKTMKDVQGAIGNVNKLDIDSLNKSIAQLTEIMNGIQAWYDNLSPILKNNSSGKSNGN